MARRKKESAFEDICEITAMLPWWLGVILALVFYIWLHQAASMPAQTSPDIKQLAANTISIIWHTAATFLQFIIPVACLIGACVSAYKRHERNGLHKQVVEMPPSRDALESISWNKFEILVGEIFRRKGYSVEQRGGKGPDGGVDLVLRKGNDRYLVQCKQWKTLNVGVATVRELYGVMVAEGVAGGFIVTSGKFTRDAENFAHGKGIELVGTDSLYILIGETARK